ncbi:hypothetical protein K8R03_01500 [Candidatus Kaiserbacteria bacterium]|nr:hypothetical protein [Candidatus Kaiserbacteria bacterium]
MSEKMPDFSKEREFHKGRWEKKAQQESERGPFKRFVDKNGPDRDADDFMREEASRDDKDFEKRRNPEQKELLHAEYKEWLKSLQPVIEGFMERVRHPEDTENTTMIIMMGGGMRGPYTAGQGISLQMMGITPDVVDMVIGTSTGAVVATAFVAGLEEMLKSTTMMIEELSSKNFIDAARVLKQEVIKLRLISDLWSQGEYKIDTDKVVGSHPDLLYTVTEPVRGDEEPKVKYLDAKSISPGPIAGVISSMSIPYITGDIPAVNGVKNYDGGFGRMNIKNDIEEFKKRHNGKPPKNILILPTMPFEYFEEMIPTADEIKFAKFARRRAGSLMRAGSLDGAASLHQVEKGLLLKHEQRKAFELIQKETGVHIGVLWPPNSGLTTTSIDGDDMKEAVLSSARDTIKQFGGKQPDEIPEYVSEKKRLKEAIADFKKAV